MKICIAHKIVKGPWGGGNSFTEQLTLFLTKRGHYVVNDFVPELDVIMLIDPRPSETHTFQMAMEYKEKYPNVKIIHRINDTDKARPYAPPAREKYFLEINKKTDHTIFISEWVRDYYVSLGFDPKYSHSVIINGCSSEYYYPQENIIGNPVKIITHHWSDGPLKGFDVYNYIDQIIQDQPSLEFTYLGRYNREYQPKNINLIAPQEPKDIGNILRNHDLYITGARWEACGMHHIEAARCGLPILYHEDGGAVPEVCKKHGVGFSDTESMFRGMQDLIDNYAKYRDNIDYDYLSMDRCCEEYERIFLNV
tara:strand:- start:759 stop:1685 length:927 start_codon:yes stop_codon:yes gene_type:complete